MPLSIPAKQLGVGLIEVLVAFSVFSVGVLGAFSVQIVAKKMIYAAAQHSVATDLARDILERMRSNFSQLDAYIVDEIGDKTMPASSDCKVQPCNELQLVAYDLHEWEGLLRGSDVSTTIHGQTLPTGGLVRPRACIQNTNGTITVAIAWRGVSKLTNSPGPDSDCGKFSGLYGEGNEHRQLLVMTTYIGNW